MKAKVLESAAGRNFSAKAGDLLTDEVYELDENYIYMKKTDIQSLINRGSAVEIKKKKPTRKKSES